MKDGIAKQAQSYCATHDASSNLGDLIGWSMNRMTFSTLERASIPRGLHRPPIFLVTTIYFRLETPSRAMRIDRALRHHA